MKIALIALGLLSFSAFAEQRVVTLDKKEINIGLLEQTNNSVAHESVLFERTANTPKVVKVKYILSSYQQLCMEWRDTTVWVPGYDHNTRYPGHDPRFPSGHYETRSVCVRSDWKMLPKMKSVHFKFRKAAKLAADEKEVFEIDFSQVDLLRYKVDLDGKVIDSKSQYDIDLSFFRNLIFDQV